MIYIQISMLEDCERLTTEKVQKTLEFCAYVPNLNISPCQRNLLKKTFQNEAKIELITKGELVFPPDLFNGCQKVPKIKLHFRKQSASEFEAIIDY